MVCLLMKTDRKRVNLQARYISMKGIYDEAV